MDPYLRSKTTASIGLEADTEDLWIPLVIPGGRVVGTEMVGFPSGYVKIAIENGRLYPFIVDLPIEHGDFPLLSHQRVGSKNDNHWESR